MIPIAILLRYLLFPPRFLDVACDPRPGSDVVAVSEVASYENVCSGIVTRSANYRDVDRRRTSRTLLWR